MINTKGLCNSLEIYNDILELKETGLDEDEVEGYIEMFCDSWFIFKEFFVVN